MTSEEGEPVVYAALADGRAHPIAAPTDPLPAMLRVPGEQPIPVDPRPQGSVDAFTVVEQPTASVEVPVGVDLRDFGLATFSAEGGPVGDSTVRLTDIGASPSAVSRDIAFSASASTGDSVAVRVGACLQ